MRNHGYAILASCLVHALVVLMAVTASTWRPEVVGRVDLTLLPALAPLTPEAGTFPPANAAPVPATAPALPAVTAKTEMPVALPPALASPVPEPVLLPPTPLPALPGAMAQPVPADPLPAATSLPPPPVPAAQPETTGNTTRDSLPAAPGTTGEAPTVAVPPESVTIILERLRSFVEYPERARRSGWEGKVVVAFRLGPDGNARDAKIVVSSGFPLLDRSALSALRRASPFPYHPRQETELLLPVVYALH